MTKTAYLPTAIPVLAAHIQDNWARVSRDLDGVKGFDRFREMGTKGYLTVQELTDIGEEKSSRLKRLLTQNLNEVVIEVTRQAFSSNSERERMRLLCSLKGVAVPRASAVLSWTHPERWPVIDQRAWRTLESHKVVKGREKGTGLGLLQWEVFLQAVYGLMLALNDPDLTPQKVDRILYQMDADENGRKRKVGCCA